MLNLSYVKLKGELGQIGLKLSLIIWSRGIINNCLYDKSFSQPLLRCLSPDEPWGEYISG